MQTDTEAREAILAVLKHEGGLMAAEVISRALVSDIPYARLVASLFELEAEGAAVSQIADHVDGWIFFEWSLP